MKAFSLLLCGLAGVWSAGCSHKTEMTSPPAAVVPVLAGAAADPVPLPARTPFDGNPKARAAYLDYYAMGYGSATADYAAPGCLCTTEGDPERYEAAMSGFFAGRAAGLAAAARQPQKMHEPAAVASGSSSAQPPSAQR